MLHAFYITLVVPLSIAVTCTHLEVLVLLHTSSYTAPTARVMLPLLLLILLFDFVAGPCCCLVLLAATTACYCCCHVHNYSCMANGAIACNSAPMHILA